MKQKIKEEELCKICGKPWIEEHSLDTRKHLQKQAQAIFDDNKWHGDTKVGKGVIWIDIDDWIELKKKWCDAK